MFSIPASALYCDIHCAIFSSVLGKNWCQFLVFSFCINSPWYSNWLQVFFFSLVVLNFFWKLRYHYKWVLSKILFIDEWIVPKLSSKVIFPKVVKSTCFITALTIPCWLRYGYILNIHSLNGWLCFPKWPTKDTASTLRGKIHLFSFSHILRPAWSIYRAGSGIARVTYRNSVSKNKHTNKQKTHKCSNF